MHTHAHAHAHTHTHTHTQKRGNLRFLSVAMKFPWQERKRLCVHRQIPHDRKCSPIPFAQLFCPVSSTKALSTFFRSYRISSFPPQWQHSSTSLRGRLLFQLALDLLRSPYIRCCLLTYSEALSQPLSPLGSGALFFHSLAEISKESASLPNCYPKRCFTQTAKHHFTNEVCGISSTSSWYRTSFLFPIMHTTRVFSQIWIRSVHRTQDTAKVLKRGKFYEN